ncbi:MAG: ABC transporter permease [Acidobacteriota bacterium]
METLLQDLRYGLRTLAKKPGFTAAALIALALGIGANSAIFSVVNAILLRPLPYNAPDRIVAFWENNLPNDIKKESTSGPNFTDWKDQAESFEAMAAFHRTSPILSGDGEPERIQGCAVTDGFFSVLKVEPALGRVFLPDEIQPGKNRVVILSDGMWRRRFGSDQNIIGKTVTLSGNPYTVVGVMPSYFRNASPDTRQPTELWMPVSRDITKMGRRGDFLSVIARLKPDVSIEQARSEMNTIVGRLEQQYTEENAGWTVAIIPLHERFVGDVKLAMFVLLGAVCFLLLIACANVANLLLARAAAREKEIAIRTALGAGRRRLVQQLLTESVALALLGGVMGLLLAVWGIELLTSLGPESIPRINEVRLDGRVLAFTLTVSLVSGIVFGLVPALQASKANLNDALKEGGRSGAESARGRRARNVLAVSEIALSFVLLIGAGLMLKSFFYLQQVNPGFNPARVLTLDLSLPSSKYPEGTPAVAAFYKQLLEQVATLPAVESVATIDSIPLTGSSVLSFAVEGRPLPPPDKVVDAEACVISPEYFHVLGIPLMKGRLFADQDAENAPAVTIINSTMARRYWPEEDPIGKRITLGDPQIGPWLTIVGIVGDVHQEALESEPYPQMYSPFAQAQRRSMSLVVRASVEPLNLVPAVRSQIRALDKDQPLYNVRTLEQVLSYSVARPRFNVLLIGIFAVIAIVLAAVGIYSVVSYSVTQRTHEIGIRMALGAQTGEVLRLVIIQGMTVALIGVGLGLAAALVLTRLMSSLLFNVTATDPLVFFAISVVLVGVALGACLVPARRAMKVDPMVALRYE